MNTLNINKFSFVQMMNDRNGKTSVSAVGGFIIIIVSCVGFLLSIYLKFSEGISGSSAFVLAGVALITGKNFATSTNAPIDPSVATPTEEPKPE